MRVAALIVVLALTAMSRGPALAETRRESRYGPSAEQTPTAVNGQTALFTGAAYGGRALGWSGKREIAAPAPVDQAPRPWWTRAQAQAPAPQAAPPAAYPAPRAAMAEAPAALPQSLYDNPPAPAVPVAPAQARFQPGQVGARTYSVGREFGLTPDPIPAAGPSRMVLIAPPPASASASAEADKPNDLGGEWSAKPEKDGGQ